MRGRVAGRYRRAFVRPVVLAMALGLVATGCLAGVGDPYYPTYGNGGYDVDHYDLAVRYDPATDVLQGVTTIVAHATTALSRFDLDLVGLTVHRITVNGRPARWTHGAHELAIVPERRAHRRPAIQRGRRVLGRSDRDGERRIHGHEGRGGGLGRTRERRNLVPRERPPDRQGDVHLPGHGPRRGRRRRQRSAPHAGRVGAGLDDARVGSARRRWRATSRRSTSATGQSMIGARPTGLRIIDAVDTSDANVTALAGASLAREGDMVDFLAQQFGPYPFETAGADRRQLRRSPSRSRPRRVRSTRRTSSSCPTATSSSCTSSRTSGTATVCRSRAGPTSGSTRDSRPTPNGCGPSTKDPPPQRRASPATTTPSRRTARSGTWRSVTPARIDSSTKRCTRAVR